jgi:hypothetical protein
LFHCHVREFADGDHLDGAERRQVVTHTVKNLR